MTAPDIRWFTHHEQDQLGLGGWTEHPDQATAEQHAGTAGTVWILATPDAIRAFDPARARLDQHATGSPT